MRIKNECTFSKLSWYLRMIRRKKLIIILNIIKFRFIFSSNIDLNMELFMKEIQIAEDIIPIGEFKTHASALLKELKNVHRSIIITQNGRPAGVVLSPKDYDFLINRQRFLDSVFNGLKDSNEGNVISDEEFKGKLESIFGQLDV